MNQKSNAVIKHHFDDDHFHPRDFLLAEIRSLRDDAWLYDVILMDIDPVERHLNTGRFERYNVEVFEYRVNMNYTWWESGIFDTMVQWINEHLEKRWNVDMIAKHTQDITIVFSFESYVDAIQFTLRWR